MCWQDIDIGKRLESRIYATVGTLSIPANKDRIAIRVTCGIGDSASLSALCSTIGGTGVTSVPIAYTSRDPAVVGQPWFLPDTPDLWNTGNLLTEQLTLVSATGVLAVAIEVYLYGGEKLPK